MINPYSEGNQFAPNVPPYAPPEEEIEHMNYSHIKYVVISLFILLSSSYIPGFLSVGDEEWQPSLMAVDIHFKNTNNGRTLYFGWDSIYNYEQKTSIETIDNLDGWGTLYLNFTLCSFILIAAGSCISYCCCKSCCFVRFFVSLLCFFLII